MNVKVQIFFAINVFRNNILISVFLGNKKFFKVNDKLN